MSARLSLPFTFSYQSGADAVKSGKSIAQYGGHPTLDKGKFIVKIYSDLTRHTLQSFHIFDIHHRKSWQNEYIKLYSRPHIQDNAGAVIANHVQPPREGWWITAGLSSIARFGVEWAAGLFAAILTWIIAFPAAVRAGWRANSRVTWLAIKIFSTATLLIFGAYFLYTSVLFIYKTLTSAH